MRKKYTKTNLPYSPGIYTITNLFNGKMYVGLASQLADRMTTHFWELRKGHHCNIKLQRAFNKYGEENFKFEILEECEEQFLTSQEHYWCNLLNVHNDKHGYNIKPTNPHQLNNRLSEETKKKISEKAKGRVWSEESKRKVSERMKGNTYLKDYKPSAEEVIRINKLISDFHKGNTYCLGFKHSEETKKKMSDSRTGKKKNWNPDNAKECSRKISEAKKGKALPEEMHEKARQANLGNTRRLGIKHTEEDRQKIKEGMEKAKEKISASRMGNKNCLGFKYTKEALEIKKEKARLTRLKNKEKNDKRTNNTGD